MSRVYVYAFVSGPKAPFDLAGRHIEMLRLNGIVAAVDRRDDAPARSEESLRQQHAIVERLCQTCEAVLPARFGALVDEAELKQIVRGRTADLRKALERVKGRVQMTVRILGVPRPNEAPKPSPRDARTRTGTDYLLERRAAQHPPRPEMASVIAAAVGRLVVVEKVEIDHAKGLAVLLHLIARSDVAVYRERVARAAAGHPSLTVRVSGPWPPFAFAPDAWP